MAVNLSNSIMEKSIRRLLDTPSMSYDKWSEKVMKMLKLSSINAVKVHQPRKFWMDGVSPKEFADFVRARR